MATSGTPGRLHRPGTPRRVHVAACGPWLLATAHPSSVLRSGERERDRALLAADLRVAATSLQPDPTHDHQETP